MKRPRFEEYATIKDPPKPTKTLQSSLDDMPSIDPPQKREFPTQEEQRHGTSEQPTVRPIVRPYDRTPVRRTTTRYAFEFFADQLEVLKQLSLEEKMHGKKGSMSEMVREAIDTYLQKRRDEMQ